MPKCNQHRGKMQFTTTHVIPYRLRYGAACWGRSANMSYFVLKHQTSMNLYGSCVRVSVSVWVWSVVLGVLSAMWVHKWVYIQFKWSEWRNNNNGMKIDNGKRNKGRATMCFGASHTITHRSSAFEYTYICTWRTLFTYASDSHFSAYITCVTTAHCTQALACCRFGSFVWDCAVAFRYMQFNSTDYSISPDARKTRTNFPQTNSNCKLL